MDLKDLLDLVEQLRGTLGLAKDMSSLLPKSMQKTEIEQKIQQAEEALAQADAKLAKELGYSFCPCTFPPQIMLWKEQEQVYGCPSPACGRVLRRTHAMRRSSPSWKSS